MIDYRGKTALVTGGASGIGRALGQALATRGATVILADVNEAMLQQTVAEIGGTCHAVTCDLADPESPARLIEDCQARAGRLDLVCSNAGIGRRGRLMKEMLLEDSKRLFEVNVFAGLRITQAYVALLQRTGQRGRLMLTASENSLSIPNAVKNGRLGLYAATKHSLLILGEWMRNELAEEPIDLHMLMPGAVYTPLIARGLPNPALAPPELNLIMPERCAEIALQAMDLGLFYVPTQAHLLDDMQPRLQGVEASLKALGLRT